MKVEVKVKMLIVVMVRNLNNGLNVNHDSKTSKESQSNTLATTHTTKTVDHEVANKRKYD